MGRTRLPQIGARSSCNCTHTCSPSSSHLMCSLGLRRLYNHVPATRSLGMSHGAMLIMRFVASSVIYHGTGRKHWCSGVYSTPGAHRSRHSVVLQENLPGTVIHIIWVFVVGLHSRELILHAFRRDAIFLFHRTIQLLFGFNLHIVFYFMFLCKGICVFKLGGRRPDVNREQNICLYTLWHFCDVA